MQEWARFATPCAFFFFFLHLRKECSDKFNTHSCGDLLAGLEDGTRLLYVDAEPNLVAALTLALWFWNQTCTTRTLSPVSAASVSLTWKRRHKRFPASHKKTKHFTARWTTLPPQHILHVGFFDLLWFHWTVEWIQRSFWTSRVIASVLERVRRLFFRPRSTEAAPLSQCDIRCTLSALHQPASVNTEQSAARHFKAQPRGGGDLVLTWEFYLQNYCRDRGQHPKKTRPQRQTRE